MALAERSRKGVQRRYVHLHGVLRGLGEVGRHNVVAPASACAGTCGAGPAGAKWRGASSVAHPYSTQKR